MRRAGQGCRESTPGRGEERRGGRVESEEQRGEGRGSGMYWNELNRAVKNPAKRSQGKEE